MSLPEAILDQRVIPVARGLDATSAPALVASLQAGGIGTIEITVEGDGGLEAIAAVSGGDVVVGAGTIVTIDQARRAVAAGAVFLVSPHLDPELLDWAEANAVPMMPGALTPTEVAAAWRRRPAAVKLFPAHLGGPSYLRSLRGPFPDVALVPTGGIDAGNAAEFLDAGALAVGVGAWLTGHRDHDVVVSRARELLAQVV